MRTILLIEDNNHIRENLAEVMEMASYHVLTAANGKTGVTIAREHIPDIIVCDIMMPELNGFGVLSILRSEPGTMHIPFIFLTAMSEPVEKKKGLAAGAYDYIIKPVGGPELLASLNNFFIAMEK